MNAFTPPDEGLGAELEELAVPNDALRADPYWCPCGHNTHGEYMCINGLIYGPCPDENCFGVCEDNAGYCKSDGCLCADI